MTGEHTETSPLLPKQQQNVIPIDPGSGIAPEGAGFPIDDEGEDGRDIERQGGNGDSYKHQGMPEIRKRMKYIFPAIAIGVSILFQYLF